jgi:hypothetical protein
MLNKKSSPGLQELLLRHGYNPSGNADKDIETAKKFMPPGWMDFQYMADEVNGDLK